METVRMLVEGKGGLDFVKAIVDASVLTALSNIGRLGLQENSSLTY